MSMSKKDFIALADALKPFYTGPADGGLETTSETPEDILRAIMQFCAGQNSQFKAQRWLSYLHGECGPSGGAVSKSKGSR